MDRFSSREHAPEFNDADFGAGVKARRNGWKLDDCPFKENSRRAKSWRYGWADEDQSIAAEMHA